MTDPEFVLYHAPKIYVDEREPFPFRYVGYNIYREKAGSRPFRRDIVPESVSKDCTCVIEYCYYLDYDIQHLYELEHIWVYLDAEGHVVGAEGSAHGKYLNAYRPGRTRFENGHIVMYAQPGKHAMAADPDIFEWFPGVRKSCNEYAGAAGLDAPAKYLTDICITDGENEKVREYIRSHFSFEPSMSFCPARIPESMYLPWSELDARIPELLKEQLHIILNETKTPVS